MSLPLPAPSRRVALQALREPQAAAATAYIIVDDFASALATPGG